ncbi:hypothetical protein ACJX0J_012384 [Zea mays]
MKISITSLSLQLIYDNKYLSKNLTNTMLLQFGTELYGNSLPSTLSNYIVSKHVESKITLEGIFVILDRVRHIFGGEDMGNQNHSTSEVVHLYNKRIILNVAQTCFIQDITTKSITISIPNEQKTQPSGSIASTSPLLKKPFNHPPPNNGGNTLNNGQKCVNFFATVLLQ